jgi:zinc protease
VKKVLLFGLIFIFIAALTALAQNPREMKFTPLKFEPAEPTRSVTDNGIIIYFLEDHQLPVITVTALFHGGTVNDPTDKIGLVEIMATLLRTGGAGKRTPDQIDQDLDFAPASIGSSAAYENLDVSLNCLKKDIDLGFEIFSDMLQKPKFDSGKIALELSNKKDGIRRQNDDPNGVTRRIFYQTVYAGHPYGNFATLASTNNISRDAIIAQYRQFYNPDNCLMAISGDMTLAEVKAIIAKYFGSWKKGNQTIPSAPIATAQFKPGVYYAEKDINQANIRMGHLGITDKNPDRYALDVFNFILGGGGFTSRLTREVRTTAGLAYSVGSYFFHRPSTGSFFAFCQTKAEAMSQATGLMLSIINKAKDSGITQEEMDLAKESIINGFVFNYTTPDQIVNAKASLELNGFPPDQLKKDLEAYQAVTIDDCRRVAAKYLDPENMVIVITGNKTLFDKPLETFGPVTNISMEIK